MAEKITIIKQFEPVETTGEIPPVPVDVTPDEADQKAARRDWDKKMPKHRGLLNAEVIDE